MEKKRTFVFSVRDIAEMGMLIGMALVLNFIKIPVGPSAGSINLQLVPLLILAFRKGWFKGFIGCGVCYGLLSCLLDNYGFATFPFDYLIGFGSCFVLGFFKNAIDNPNHTYSFKGEMFLLLACIIATLIRFSGSMLSSIIVYGYDFRAALIYNIPYIGISGAASAVVVCCLLGPILKIDHLFPSI